jgi:cupin 2 domain-containing protein
MSGPLSPTAMPAALPNLFDDLRPREQECIEVLAAVPGTRIERIVSWGQASPAGFWYDQHEGEWVALLRGRARLALCGPDETVELAAGDWLWIAPRRRHRIEWTEPGVPTVWLAVFVPPAPPG